MPKVAWSPPAARLMRHVVETWLTRGAGVCDVGSMKLELFYDIVSPYSYLALACLHRYRAAWSMELVLRPAWLHGVMKSVGNVPPATLAARAPYLMRDLQRLAGYTGVELRLPDVFPGNTTPSPAARSPASQYSTKVFS